MFPSIHGVVSQGGKIAPAPPFSPDDLANLALWFDAADDATITEVSGVVSEWADKSGNDWHATQGTSGSRPARVAGAIGGKPALRFDGSDDHLLISNSTAKAQAMASLAGATAFLVASSSAGSGVFNRAVRFGSRFTVGPSTSSRQLFEFYRGNDETIHAAGRRRINTSGASNVGKPGVFTGPAVLAARMLYSDGAEGGMQFRVDGAYVGRSDFGDSATSSEPSALNQDILIGASWTASDVLTQPWQGDIAEFLLYQRHLGDDEVAQVEAYLAAKWGVTLIEDAPEPFWGIESMSGQSPAFQAGRHGWKFLVGNNDLVVNALRVRSMAGIERIKIHRVSDGAEIASVDSSGSGTSSWRSFAISEVTLESGVEYTISTARSTLGARDIYANPSSISYFPGITRTGGVTGNDHDMPTTPTATEYATVDFGFE